MKNRNRFHRTFLTDINRIIQQDSRTAHARITQYGLTHKEYKVIQEMAKGHTNKEIASILYITEDTVKYRLKQLYKKWQVTSRDAALRMARDKCLL